MTPQMLDIARMPPHFGRMTSQLDMFAEGPALPEGFRYEAGMLTVAEQAALLADIRPLPFREFEFQGFLGKRRVVSFGWKYDFNTRELRKSDDIPGFLLPLREKAALFAGLAPEALQQVLVTEYSPGAGIGWHKDKAVFGEVVGISLGAACTFRLRRREGGGWQRRSLVAEPGSLYLLSGPARSEWEHSIPPVGALRHSVTFRNFRGESGAGAR